MTEYTKCNIGFIFGCLGVAAGIFYGAYVCGPQIDKVQVFQREQGKSVVMRLYKSGRDGVMVENSERKGEYLPMNKYLDRIKDKAERNIEEAQIEKAVKWYEE